MKRLSVATVMAALAFLGWTANVTPMSPYSYFLIRPQGENCARALVGWQQLRDAFFAGEYIKNHSLAFEYSQSFRPADITHYLFGAQQLVFSGSRVANRGPRDILADYFGLPTDFVGGLVFDPKIENALIELDGYYAFDALAPGVYLRYHLPLCYSRWELNAREIFSEPGVLNYPAGYMSPLLIDRNDLPTKILTTLSGQATWGDMRDPLAYGRFCPGGHVVKLADAVVALGYTPYIDNCSHLGYDVQVVIPTGTRSTARAVFEPQVGNGHHYAVGAKVTAHRVLREGWRGDWDVSLYVDAQYQYLFSSLQKRSFDLKGAGPGSRYLLLEDIGSALSTLVQFGTATDALIGPAIHQYHGRIFHAINETTLDTKIKINAQVDVAVKLAFMHPCYQIDIGYNFWGRSREQLVCRERFPSGRFAIKGDAQLYGYYDAGSASSYIALNATQSMATLHAGQRQGNANGVFDNRNADNATQVFFDGSLSGGVVVPLLQTWAGGSNGAGFTGTDPVSGSRQSIFLSDADIDNCSGLAPAACSHSLFAHLSHTCELSCGAARYLGIGAKVEWAGRSRGVRPTYSDWGVWLKIGIVC